MVNGHGKTVRIADDTGHGGGSRRLAAAPGTSTNAVTEAA